MKIFSLCHHYRNISVCLFVCLCLLVFDGSASISHIIDAANLTNVALQFLFVATGGRLFRSVKWFNQLYTQMMSIYILYKMSEVLNLDLFMLGYVLIFDIGNLQFIMYSPFMHTGPGYNRIQLFSSLFAIYVVARYFL